MMQAIHMTAAGGPEVLEQVEVPVPGINTPTGVRVKLHAAGINPVDTKLRSGVYPVEPLPAVLGCDGSGVIDACGDAVRDFKTGDAVYFFHGGLGGSTGNYAEYIVLDERFIAPKPDSVDHLQAAAAPLVLLTAWESLFDRANIKQDDCVLIHAGAGGVGHVAIQLAKHAGARVITTVGSEEKAGFVRELGADEVIYYKDQDFVAETLRLTEDLGADMVMDNVGNGVFERSFAATRVYGDVVTLHLPGRDVDWSIARFRNLRISQEIMLTPLLFGLEEAQRHQTWILNECAGLIDSGKLRVQVSATYSLQDIRLAHQAIESGSTSGKLVIKIE
ncbi:MAG: zinc-dependent alcohol dehydrogenase family protein [Thiotrichales bacterium]|nr:zinc-dependent alcohol dehydrogenase family protein [Thiotrichales bacterium]